MKLDNFPLSEACLMGNCLHYYQSHPWMYIFFRSSITFFRQKIEICLGSFSERLMIFQMWLVPEMYSRRYASELIIDKIITGPALGTWMPARKYSHKSGNDVFETSSHLW